MTPAGGPTPLDAVRQLMSERAKFEKWLTDLEAKKQSTPAHVFDRVKADYTSRLQGVLDKLRQHTESLNEHATSLAKKLQQLADSEQGILDTRAEQELRAQVGELSQGDWEKTSKKLERDLAKVKQDQELISSDLNNLRELLGSFEGASAAAAAPSQPVGDSRSDSAGETAGASPSSSPNVDELAFLKSVIGATPPAAAKAPAESQPDAPAATAKPAEPPKEKLVEAPVPGPVIKSRPGEEPLAMHVTGSNPIVLRSSGVVEQPKTLKCGECGSMNYPSEWYCERCGAELTNI